MSNEYDNNDIFWNSFDFGINLSGQFKAKSSKKTFRGTEKVGSAIYCANVNKKIRHTG